MVSVSDRFEWMSRYQTLGVRGRELRRVAMSELSQMPGYDWAGIYRLEGNRLELDEFVGTPTDHKVIEIGVGVCGTAIQENANQIVEDVRELDNYLACNLETRSEIVVLIRRDETILGQIDIDSHQSKRFTLVDEIKLNELAKFLAENWDDDLE